MEATALERWRAPDDSFREKGLLLLGMSPVDASLEKGFLLGSVASVFTRRILLDPFIAEV